MPGSSAAAGDATAEGSPLRVDLSGAPRRLRLDWKAFAFLVAALLTALALVAVVRATSTMLTRIGIGVLLALALDPLTDRIHRRTGSRRGIAVAIVAVLVFGLAALLIGVLGPRAVDEARQFSDQLPATLDELEELPLVGGYLRDNEIAEKAQDWIRRLPDELTDERITATAETLVSGIASIVMVSLVAIAVLIDGTNLVGRLRRLLPHERRAQADEVGDVMYRTLGRYVGGSVTVALMMGLYVLTVGLLLGVPLIPLAAVWAMLTDLIPQVGGFLGGSFFVLLAATQSVPTALVAGAAFVLYMNVENHVIQPAIVGRSVNLTPPTTMVAAFVGGAVAGVPGALVATPLAGAAKSIYLEARGVPQPDEGEREGLLARLRRKLPGGE